MAAPTVGLVIVTVIASTKVPILLGHGYLFFASPAGSKTGFWSMLHEARTDFSMILGSVFLLVVGAGGWSLDVVLQRRLRAHSSDRGHD